MASGTAWYVSAMLLPFWATAAAAAEAYGLSETKLAIETAAPESNLAIGTSVMWAASEASTTSQETNPADEVKRTEVIVTPYLWIAGTSGDIGVPRGQNDVSIDKSFTDILGSLKFAFMGSLDVRHDRFVVLGDIIYLSVGMDVDGVRNPPLFTGEVDAKVLVSTLAAGYRVVDRGPLFVDVFAGGRVTAIDVDLELEGPLTTREADESVSKVSPLVGARVRVPLSESWSLGLYADVGSSPVRWQGLASVHWDISTHWSMLAGYRHMKIDHDANRLDFNVKLSGPLLGFSYRF